MYALLDKMLLLLERLARQPLTAQSAQIAKYIIRFTVTQHPDVHLRSRLTRHLGLQPAHVVMVWNVMMETADLKEFACSPRTYLCFSLGERDLTEQSLSGRTEESFFTE